MLWEKDRMRVRRKKLYDKIGLIYPFSLDNCGYMGKLYLNCDMIGHFTKDVSDMIYTPGP